jgi:hypothetical protein
MVSRNQPVEIPGSLSDHIEPKNSAQNFVYQGGGLDIVSQIATVASMAISHYLGVVLDQTSWPQPGHRMQFTGKGGYDGEIEHASSKFEPNQILTVKEFVVGGSASRVIFNEIDGGWNSVLFEWLDDPRPPEDVSQYVDPA